MAFVIGVDVGGTFTDAVLDDDAGSVIAAKAPSTPPDYSRGVLDVLELLAEQLGRPVEEMLAETHHIAHGTTSSLNALVQRRVPDVGFLTTKGHRDSIFIMNVEGRYLGRSPHELQHVLAQDKDHHLLPKRHALEVTERVDRDGNVIVALDEDEVRRRVEALRADGVRAIAVSLLWAFRNPVHERRIREIVAEVAPDVYVALSSEVSPRIREFARNSTTIMSTQVGPGLRDYLSNLESSLKERGLAGPLLVMQSNGGAVAAGRRPSRPSRRSGRCSPAASWGRRPWAGGSATATSSPPTSAAPRSSSGSSSTASPSATPRPSSTTTRSTSPRSRSTPSAPAAARSRGSTPAATSASARTARRPSPAPPATTRAAPSPPTPTPTSSSASSRRRVCSAVARRSTSSARERPSRRRSPTRWASASRTPRRPSTPRRPHDLVGRALQHDARRRRRPRHLMDAAAPRDQPRHRRGRHVPHQRPLGRRRPAPERRDGLPAGVLGGEALRLDLRDRPPADLGGVGLGSFSPAAQDVFSESLPTPPIKVVREGQLQDDVADVWVRRSRVPMMIGLDLRAKVGANTVGRDRLLAVIEQYGADTVKAVMKRMMSDAESRLRGKLRDLPDGTWRATGYQDQSHTGDRELHKITVAMTKADDHITFDFTGTDPQSGVVNCTYAGMRGGVMLALLPILAGDIPWSAGGLMRCFDLVSEEGTINNASFPAAVGRGPIGPAWLTGNLVAECLSQMLDQAPELGNDGAHVQSVCCGTWDTAVIAGLDQRGAVPTPFLSILMDPMAGGYGAQPQADGMDTGGLFCIPLGRVPDVEMTEFLYPVLALWRREEPDSGGPGRRRGGVGASLAITPHGTSLPIGLVLASNGKAVSQNNGLAGGYPGNTGVEWIARGSDVTAMLGAGTLPTNLADVGGTPELQPCYGETHVAPGEVFTMFWQGGGGYGDPLVRDPSDVARDVREQKVTAATAERTYGVVVDASGAVDTGATEDRRRELRDARRARVGGQGERSTIDLTGARRLDDNLVAVGDQVACRHCATVLGSGALGELDLVRHEGPVSDAGPQVVDGAGEYVDREVHFRQYCCPGCFTAVSTAVVPVDHVDDVTRTSRVLADARS